MTRSRRLAVLLGCVAVALVVAWYAGARFPAPAPAVPTGTVRLGPDAGEAVAEYLARLPADLPPPGTSAPALVQFTDPQDRAGALAAIAGAAPLLAVLRVPIPRVQTALRFEALEAQVDAPTALDSARLRARAAALADAGRLTGRPRDVAAAEAVALADPGCACVLAVVVRADRGTLDALATRPAVRAVQAAPPDAGLAELALAPLLPEQAERADPGPDDGPLPPS